MAHPEDIAENARLQRDAEPDDIEEIDCPECEGLGFIETDDEGTIDCDECDGNGTIAP